MSYQLSPGKNPPSQIDVIIEIPAFSEPVKYEVDKDGGCLRVDRFMATCMQYPCNYGYVPDTLSEDDDPVDVLVVTPHPLRHGCVIAARPLGMLAMTDEKGPDAKILAVPDDKLCALYHDVKTLDDLPKLLLDQIEHFFTNYKALEKGKWVKVDGWRDLATAEQEIMDSIARAK
jgi:inorganic pyrophosphatase